MGTAGASCPSGLARPARPRTCLTRECVARAGLARAQCCTVHLMATDERIDLAIGKYAAGMNKDLVNQTILICEELAQITTLMIAAIERWVLYKNIGLINRDSRCLDDIRKNLIATMEKFVQLVNITEEKRTKYPGDRLLIKILDFTIRSPLETFVTKNKDQIKRDSNEESWIPDLGASRYLRSCIWLALTELNHISNASLDARQYRDGAPAAGGNLPDVGVWELLSAAITEGIGISELAAKMVGWNLDYNRNGIKSKARRLKNETDRLGDAHNRWRERVSRGGATSK